MTERIPKVGILMPVYNLAPFIKESIQSILDQSHKDFELLIIDDCSNDGTFELISEFKDDRIRLIRNDENKGLVYGLNLGLSLLNNAYIARMDGDDVSYTGRLEAQVSFMEDHPEVVLCGTQARWRVLDSNNKITEYYDWLYPEGHDELKVNLIWSASFIHPSVMLRNSVIRQNALRYDAVFDVSCEDWDLWSKLADYGRLANLPERLMEYSVRKNSLHRMNSVRTAELRKKVRRRILSRYDLSFESLNLLSGEVSFERSSSADLFNNLKKAYQELYFKANGKLNHQLLRNQIALKLAEDIAEYRLGISAVLRACFSRFYPTASAFKKMIKYLVR